MTMNANDTTQAETDRLMTDGGRPDARREDYWERLASDGGTDDVEDETPLSLLVDSMDRSETLHAVIPTDRDGEVLSVLALREADARDGDGTVFHLRYARIDRDDRSVAWTDNGMFIGRESNTPAALLKTFAAVRDGTSEETIQALNGLGAGDDDLARSILTETIEEPEQVDHSDEAVESDTAEGDLVECEKCGKKAPMSELENFGGGLVDAFVHSGGCPTDE